MFSTIFNSVVQKLSGLNPIKTFIKYALDKFLNQLINNQIRLEDFKNGCLNLAEIGFNVNNVNMKHLISSPYIMHSGSIGNLKIQLPNLAEVVAKSIQIQVHQILIELKPNKDFYKNFKERMNELQQNSLFDLQQSIPDQQLSENNPMDFFKETLKKILLNIKIKVENIVVKIYMSNPQDTSKKTPFYLMVRIPTINVHKSNDLKKSKNINVEQIKLDIQMPQFIVNLMSEKDSNPEYTNQQFKKQDFPFIYPTVNHPSTILLFGLNQFKGLNIQTDKNIPRLTISVINDNKQQKRDIKISAVTSKIQFMIDPLQLKILSRFLYQIKQFKNILSFVKNQFIQGQGQSSNIDAPICKRVKSGQIKHQDVFSSICMSIWEQQSFATSKVKKNSSIIDTVIRESSDLQQSVHEFNSAFKKQLQQKKVLQQISQQMTSELRFVNFKKRLQINLQVSSVYLYVLKNVPVKSYYRKWMNTSQDIRINQTIPTSYFMFSLQGMNFNMQEKQKRIKLSISKLKLQNVKLFQSFNSKHIFAAEDEFVDVQSSTYFYSMNGKSTVIKNTISQFRPMVNEHYCVEQIIRISQKPSQNYFSQNLRKYNLLPKHQDHQQMDYLIFKPGFQFSLNQKKQVPVINVDILQIVVSINPQIIKQILDIYYPINEFKKLSQQLVSEQFISASQYEKNQKEQKNVFKRKTLLQSQYNFGMQYVAVEQFISRKQKPLIEINIQQINLGYYECSLQDFTNLVRQQKQNKQIQEVYIKQEQIQLKQNQQIKQLKVNKVNKCFCKMNKKGIYLQSFGILIQVKNENIKLQLKRIVTGYIQLKNSRINKIKAILNISSKKQIQKLRLIIQNNHQTKIQNISFIINDCSINIQQKYTLNLVELIKSQILIVQQLFYYYHYLKSTMDTIQKSGLNFQKKNKKNQLKYDQNIQIYIETLHITVLKTQLYIKHIYLQKFTEQFIIKLSTLVFSVKQNIQLFLNVMKNQQLSLTQYIQKSSRYPFTQDSNIIFQINDDTYKYIPFQIKNKKQFFQNLSKSQGSILFHLSKTSVVDQNSAISKSRQVISSKDKFQFTKKPSLKSNSSNYSNASIIAQQQQQKKIIINISSTIYVSANNVFRLLQKKDELSQFVQKISHLINQISVQTKVFSKPERKTSTDSDIQKVQQMDIKISAGRIYVDIRPSFMQKQIKNIQKLNNSGNNIHHNSYERQIIFSSSRSYLQFEWDNIDAYIQKRIQKSVFRSNFSMKYLFLYHEQRQIITNPIFINEKQLGDLGFLQIFSIKNFRFETQIIKDQIRFKLFQISSINLQSSLQTLSYIRLHWQHFINHNILRKFGITIKQQQQKFQILQIKNNQYQYLNYQSNQQYQHLNQQQQNKNQFNIINNNKQIIQLKYQNQINSNITRNKIKTKQSSQYIEDLTHGFQKYQQKINFKLKSQNDFKSKPFSQIKSQNNQNNIILFIKQLNIKQIKLKIYSGSDFEFVSFKSFNQSQIKKRHKVDHSEILKYIELRADLFSLSLKLNKQKTLQSFLKLQNFEINYSDKKQPKNGLTKWFKPSNYSIEQVVFPIIRNSNTIKILFQTSPKTIYLKLNKTTFDIGFTSDIIEFVNQFQHANNRIKYSGWKKLYQTPSQQKIQIQDLDKNQDKGELQNTKLILIYIPQNRLNIRLIYKGISILSNQGINASEFMLHEQSNRSQRMGKIVQSWVKKLILQNVGSLISGTTLNFMGDIITQILKVVKFLLSCIFRSGVQIQQE